MTRPGLVPLGVRGEVGPLPAGVAALAVAPAAPKGATVTVDRALGAQGRGYALRLALHALAAPRPAGVPFAGVVAIRADWRP